MREDFQLYDHVLQLVGNIPLIKLNKVTKAFKVDFFAKVEGFNPGHSTKDRIALHIIEESEKKRNFKTRKYYYCDNFWKYRIQHRHLE